MDSSLLDHVVIYLLEENRLGQMIKDLLSAYVSIKVIFLPESVNSTHVYVYYLTTFLLNLRTP